jgi:hypothetical protein
MDENAPKKKDDQTTITKHYGNKWATKIFSWMDWVVGDNLPFTFVEKELTRKYCNLDTISTSTFMKYLRLLTTAVEEKITAELPSQLGLLIDGWSEGSTHFIALFASFLCKNGKVQTRLLSIAPPSDEESLSAESHKKFVIEVLEVYKKSVDDVKFLVGDNASVNKKLSDLLGVPFVGCASHRFNLACQKYLEPHEVVLKQINSLMGVLRNIKQAGKLRKKTHLEPVKRNVTRWSSTFEMVTRFFELRPYIEESDPELAQYLPSSVQVLTLQKLLESLKKMEAVTKKLQGETCTLSDVRAIFDAVILAFPNMAHHLAADAKIVHSPDFENAVVKIQEGQSHSLTDLEKAAASVFSVQNNSESPLAESLDFVSMALKVRNKKKKVQQEFVNLGFVSPTSNVVERLFSAARMVLTDYRKSMSPYSFECVMFLKTNRALWTVHDINSLLKKNGKKKE